MSRKDQKVYQNCLDVINGKLSIKEFSILLGKSYRQSQRIVQKVKKKGMSGVKQCSDLSVLNFKSEIVRIFFVFSVKLSFLKFNFPKTKAQGVV